MNESRNICIALPSLICGGTERTASLLANHFAQQNYIVTILLLSRKPVFYLLDERIKIIRPTADRSKIHRFLYLLYLMFFIRRQLKFIKPDRLFILGYISLFLFSLKGTGHKYKIIISNRSSPLRSLFPFYQKIRNTLYKSADGMIAQTSFAASVYKSRIRHKNIKIIPNFLRDVKKHRVVQEELIVTVGRLVPEKGHQLLLKAFANAEVKGWKLVIVGGGPLEQNLKATANSLGLAEKVIFTGFSTEVDLWLSKAGIFVLSSLTEGYPNALIEAMSLSLPCISFNCIAGPAEIIEDGFNGILVAPADANALSIEITRLIDNNTLRSEIGKNAASINETNNFDRLANEYEKFIFE